MKMEAQQESTDQMERSAFHQDHHDPKMPIDKYIEQLRVIEIGKVYERIRNRTGARLLEIGAGAGWQARWLSNHGFNVTAVELFDGIYNKEQVFDVQYYTGNKLPFEDKSFDIIFSSNVLEHVSDIDSFEQEIQRVLGDDGLAIHLVPSATWRFWTTITSYVALFRRWFILRHKLAWNNLIERRHGERGNTITEMYYFSAAWWQRHFRRCNWEVLQACGHRLFYTGYTVFGPQLSFQSRELLSKIIGSSCNLFILRKQRTRQ